MYPIVICWSLKRTNSLSSRWISYPDGPLNHVSDVWIWAWILNIQIPNAFIYGTFWRTDLGRYLKRVLILFTNWFARKNLRWHNIYIGWLYNNYLRAHEVCTKHDAIALSTCRDILFFALTYLHDVMYRWWDPTFRLNH